MEQNLPAVGAPVEPTIGPEDAAFSAWYAANEHYLVTQQFTSYVAAAAWKAGQAAERNRLCAAIKAANDKASEIDYMLDSDDCICVIRGTWNPVFLKNKT